MRLLPFTVVRHASLAAALALGLALPAAVLAIPEAASAATSVSDVSVHPSPPATGVKNTAYTISFTATDGISSTNGAPLTIILHGGATWSFDPQMVLTDDTNPTDSPGDMTGGFCLDTDTSNTKLQVSGICGFDVPAGDRMTAAFTDSVNNPSTPGSYTLSVATNNDPMAVDSAPFSIVNEGYWLVGSDGGVFTFGQANFYGSTGSLKLQRPVVGIVSTADHGGYWLDASDGGVFSYGDTAFFGSIPGLGLHPAGSGVAKSLNAPIVGMVPSYDDHGYFMVASDGGVFTFGDAKFSGSCPGIGGCAGSAVSVLPDSTGNGYWLVTNLGAIYAFGDAPYFGAPGNNGAPVTAAVRTSDGGGYWVLAADGTVSNYGDAAALGAQGHSFYSDDPATAIFSAFDNQGASVAYSDGGIQHYGDAPSYGDMSGTNLNGSIIAASGF